MRSAEPCRCCVADLSFISLGRVRARAGPRCTTAAAELVLLVKPQFEAGRGSGWGGAGSSATPTVHRAVLRGRDGTRLDRGPRAGRRDARRRPAVRTGNVEFFFRCRKGGRAPIDDAALDAVGGATAGEAEAA